MNEQAGSLMVCAVAPDSLFMSVTVVVQATGGTAQGKSPALTAFLKLFRGHAYRIEVLIHFINSSSISW